MAKTSEMKKVVRACVKQGLTNHGKQQNGHYLISNFDKVTDDNGETLPGESIIYVSVPSTPRRDNGVRNAIARLRRHFPDDFKWNGH